MMWIKFPLAFLLVLALVFYTGRLLEDLDTGRLHLTPTLSVDSQTFYTNLESPLSLTYITKHLKGVKTPVRNLLARLKALAPDRIDYRIVDPDSEPGRTYAIKKKGSTLSCTRYSARRTQRTSSLVCARHCLWRSSRNFDPQNNAHRYTLSRALVARPSQSTRPPPTSCHCGFRATTVRSLHKIARSMGRCAPH